jgi:hypothetical protein
MLNNISQAQVDEELERIAQGDARSGSASTTASSYTPTPRGGGTRCCHSRSATACSGACTICTATPVSSISTAWSSASTPVRRRTTRSTRGCSPRRS